jgi:Sec-independent protein translocase protein TatA
MAMNRAGLKSLMGYDNGGGVDSATDTGSGLGSLSLDPVDVIQNFKLYSSIMDAVSPPPRRLTGYDLASSIGAGLLGQPLQEKIPSTARGVGLGFQMFKKLQDEIDEQARKDATTKTMTAFGLASKSKTKPTLKSLSLYKDANANVANSFIVGDTLIFKGYDKAKGEVYSLNEEDFFNRYPTMRPTTEAQLGAGMLKAGEMNKLQTDIQAEIDSGGKLEDYLLNQKDREVGFKILADNFVGLIKTVMGTNNLTEDEMRKAILDADFQSLLGGFRIETVGPGVMTEYDAQRIVKSLGGEPGALQNPVLVARS